MSKQIFLDLEDDLFEQANDILENVGLDFQSATKMFLKRVIKEGTISFLLSQKAEANFDNSITESHSTTPILHGFDKIDKGDMTKSKAVRLLASKGHWLGKNVTFASKNRGAYNYWANVEFDMLSTNWSLILNDWINKVVYLFIIPAHTIKKDELTPRSDKPYLIDLQIMYNDTTFTDNRSGYSFAKFLVEKINY